MLNLLQNVFCVKMGVVFICGMQAGVAEHSAKSLRINAGLLGKSGKCVAAVIGRELLAYFFDKLLKFPLCKVPI